MDTLEFSKTTDYESLFWNTWYKDPTDKSLVLRYAYRLKGKLSVSRLRHVLTYYLQQLHVSCNYSFHVGNKGLFKKKKAVTAPLLWVDLQKCRIDEALQYVEHQFANGFDLTKGPLYKFILIQFEPAAYLFAFAFSHIIFDGMSYPKFCNLLEKLYNHSEESWSLYNCNLNPVVKSYDEQDLFFWKQKMQQLSFHQKLHFVPSTRYTANENNRSWKHSYIFSKEETIAIKQFLSCNGFTIFHFITATLATVISKYNRENDEEEGSIMMGHTLSVDPTKSGIGCFTNLNPLYVFFFKNDTPSAILQRIKQWRTETRPHQHLPIAKIAACIEDQSLTATSFTILVNPSPALVAVPLPSLDGLTCELLLSPCPDGPHAIAMLYHEMADQLHVQLHCKETLCSEEQANEIASNYIKIVRYFYTHCHQALMHCKLTASHHCFAAPSIKLAKQQGLPYLLQATLQRHTDKLALVYKEEKWTYGKLENEVKKILFLLDSRIDHALYHSHKPIRIGILLKRSPWMLVSILSSLLRDLCFVPLDSNHPLDRLRYIVHHTQLCYILTDQDSLYTSDLVKKNTYPIDFIHIHAAAEHSVYANTPLILPATALDCTLPQYILFTSGSTGQPKGVIITQENLYNFLLGMQYLQYCHAEDYFLALSSLNFDISLLELLLPIYVGGTVDIAATEIVADSQKLMDRIHEKPVTILQATPSTFRMLQTTGRKIERPLKILVGGERLDPVLADSLLQQNHTLYHMYGPTETTIWSTSSPIIRHEQLSLGLPIANTTLYIWDAARQPLPMGMLGELYIGGKGVGLGYINATDPSFVTLENGERLYKTGDLVRYYGNNYLKFIGRSDNQVKVRGFRVELSEVTKGIKETVDCYEAATVLRLTPEPHLTAFIQPVDPHKMDVALVQKRLSKKLPDYMIPQSIVPLHTFPLTPNLKIDHKKLQKDTMQTLIADYGYAAATMSVVKENRQVYNVKNKLVTLMVDSFSIAITEDQHDHPLGFFGFHSISLNRLACLLAEHFKRTIQPHDFYQHNTINKLSLYCSASAHLHKPSSSNYVRTVPPTKHSQRLKEETHIAIVGAAASLPQAPTLHAFWNHLLTHKNAIIPNTRSFLLSDFRAGFINHIDQFDASFFNISPLEAIAMDPQQRLLLETTWHVLEDAGYSSKALEGGKIGVYIAVTEQAYYVMQRKYSDLPPTPYSMLGIANALLSNRISHFFNWHGPSQTIDTACSGSLVALVRACHDLSNGIIDFALVASANLILDSYINTALGNFLSPHYRCATFDASADGYVRGEGVGAVLLKRAEEAEKEGDHSYGTLVSCVENHGGRSHSLTAPNPEAQKNLLLAAYKEPDLAREISFIETHGTATPLGDPIEVDALKMAWRAMGCYDARQKIALGAVKTHIGHLEPAAGIAALLKVLLCLKHKTLPANLHFHRLNPYIELKDSPFYIIRENQTWEGTKTAGISSFGFGGSNAHVVLRETEQRTLPTPPYKAAYLMLLSAKTEWSLVQYVQQLLAYLPTVLKDLRYHIAHIAYTLHKGRTHFSYRAAWIIQDVEDWIRKLQQFDLSAIRKVTLKEKQQPFLKEKQQPFLKEKQQPFLVDGDTKPYLTQLQQCQKAYLQGYPIEGELLYQKDQPALKVSLPGYVFQTKSYWFEEGRHAQGVVQKKKQNNYNMHLNVDLLDRNSARITVPLSHVWFSQHVVNTHKMLPGVAHISLVWLVAEQLFPGQSFQGFENVNWMNPIIGHEETVSLLIKVTNEGPHIDYAITDATHTHPFSTGTLLTASSADFQPASFTTPWVEKQYEADYLYAFFEKSGITYGPFFRGLDKVKIVNDSSCYAEITLPTAIDPLKTNLLDSAFQSLLGLSMDSSKSTPLLPFSLGKMLFHSDYFSTVSDKFFLFTEKISDMRVNITIFDAQKCAMVTIHDLGVRPLVATNSYSHEPKIALLGDWPVLTFTPRWHRESLAVKESNDNPYLIIGYSHEDPWLQACKAAMPTVQTMILDQPAVRLQLEALLVDNTEKEIWFVDAATHLSDTNTLYRKAFYFIECLKWLSNHSGLSIKVVAKSAIPLDSFSPSIQPQNTLLLGLAQTAAKEFTQLTIIPISADKMDLKHIQCIHAEDNSHNPNNEPILIHKGERYLRQLWATAIAPPKTSQFRNQGSYLIIGGLGGLGKVLATYLLQKYDAQLILIGRSQQVDKQLETLQGFGGKVVYESVDLLDELQLERVILKYPTLHGIVHSALILQDKTIQFMDQQTLYKVLDPKVKGSMHLLNCLTKHNISLDFILFFSSIQSFIANPGQANYTAACVFKDALAMLLRNSYMYTTKVINWGYWGHVGIVSTAAHRARMSHLGIGSIEPEEGLPVIEALLASDVTQIAVLKASTEALDRLHIKIEDSLDFAKELLQAIVPIYNPHSKDTMAHQDAQQALEAYSRYAIQHIHFPKNTLDKYTKLEQAIAHMEPVKHFDKTAMLEQFPWLQGHVHLLDRCLQYYPSLLTGAMDPMSVLFPDGKFDLVEPIYRDNPIANYFNEVVSKVVASYLSLHKDIASVKLIEIGAGTGSTAECILPILPKHIPYYFTDLSYAFLNKAKNKFAHFPNVIYQRHDIEQSAIDALLHQFDVVIATNVLHATRDIGHTLTNAGMLLKENGIIVLNEVTAKQDYATLTFGLTPGWWLFQDDRIQDSPLLDAPTWISLLQKSGFKAVQTHGSIAQQVIVAVVGENQMIGHSIGNMPSVSTPSVVEHALSRDSPESGVLRDVTQAGLKKDKDKMAITLRNFITDAIATIMQIPLHDIKPDTVFSTYGIDSLIVLELLKPFKSKFGYIPTTILFEYPTINKLTHYFLENHQLQLEKAFPMQEKEQHGIILQQTSIAPNGNQATRPPNKAYKADDIAIIGIAGLLPQAQNCQEFWNNLLQGKSCIDIVPRERWDVQSFYDADRSLGKMYTTYGGFIKDVDCFDHTFFGITPYDAENMDPQERLFLQTSYHAIEDAGYSRSKLAGTATAVFVGVMNGPYAWVGIEAASSNWADSLYWSIANRLSYIFDWSGPSMAIDTACSSSLTALHLACQAIQSGDCSLAIVGGTNLILHPRQYTKLCRLNMLASGAQCRSFGAQADGFVDGEGIVALVVKKYQEAFQDQDQIYGIIRGSTVNAGGKSNGYTAPNPNAQAALVRNMLSKAAIAADSIGYVEAHGTATALGDPVEIRGLTKAFQSSYKQSCALGSVKSNIGHLESAAGLAGVLKVLLQMKYKTIVPSLHAEAINPHLNITDTPFYLARSKQHWQAMHGIPRRALVNSFGAGGANASVILEEAPAAEKENQAAYSLTYYLIPLSAQSLNALQGQVDALRIWLAAETAPLYAMAYTLACTREHYVHRICFVVRNHKELLHKLRQPLVALLQASQSKRLQPIAATDYHNALLLTMPEGQLKELFLKIATAYQDEAPIQWESIYTKTQCIALPAYAFDKHRHWIERPKHGLSQEEQFMHHHKINSQPIAPSALSLAKIFTKFAESGNPIHSLQDVYWFKPIVAFDGIESTLMGETATLQDAQGTIYCKGTAATNSLSPLQAAVDAFLQEDNHELVEHSTIYAQFRQWGYHYGSIYQKLRFVKRSTRTAIGIIDAISPNSHLAVSPFVIDAGLQAAVMPLMVQDSLKNQKIALPFYLKKFNLYKNKLDELLYCYVNIHDIDKQAITYTLYFVDVQNRAVLSLEEMVSKIIEKSNFMFSADLSCTKSTPVSDHIAGVKIYTFH